MTHPADAPHKGRGKGIIVSPAKSVGKDRQMFYKLARQARRNAWNRIMGATP